MKGRRLEKGSRGDIERMRMKEDDEGEGEEGSNLARKGKKRIKIGSENRRMQRRSKGIW